MLRIADLVLFLAPAAAFLAWRALSAGRGPSGAALAGTLGGLLAFGALLAWLGIARRIEPGHLYVPARLVDGRIVAGHAGAAIPPAQAPR